MAAANDTLPPAVNAEPLPPERVYPPARADSPVTPITGLWRVSSRTGLPKMIIEHAAGEPIELVAVTPFPPFCRGHFSPITASQELRI